MWALISDRASMGVHAFCVSMFCRAASGVLRTLPPGLLCLAHNALENACPAGSLEALACLHSSAARGCLSMWSPVRNDCPTARRWPVHLASQSTAVVRVTSLSACVRAHAPAHRPVCTASKPPARRSGQSCSLPAHPRMSSKPRCPASQARCTRLGKPGVGARPAPAAVRSHAWKAPHRDAGCSRSSGIICWSLPGSTPAGTPCCDTAGVCTAP